MSVDVLPPTTPGAPTLTSGVFNYTASSDLTGVVAHEVVDAEASITPASAWTSRSLPSTQNWAALGWGNGTWVAAGSTAQLATSLDGVVWTTRSATAQQYMSIAYGKGVFVALGASSGQYSTNHGATWGLCNAPVPGSNWASVTFHAGQFCMLGATGQTAYSSDGVTFSAGTQIQQAMNAITSTPAVGGANGTMVAVGPSSAIYTSTDLGASWSGRSVGSGLNFNAVIWGGGQFVALAPSTQGNASAGMLATSPNGVTWTLRPGLAVTGLQSVTYGNGTYIVTGNTGLCYTSPDAVTWTQRTALPVTTTSWRCAWGGGQFIALGYNTNLAATTPDGDTVLNVSGPGDWVSRQLPITGTWGMPGYGNGTYVVPVTTSSAAISSTDTIGWTVRALPSHANWNLAVYGNGTWLVTNSSTTAGAISVDDAVTWTARTLPTSTGGAAYLAGKFILLPQNGANAYTSTDAVTWTARSLAGISAPWAAVAGNGNTLVAVASSSTSSAVSTDGGLTWNGGGALPGTTSAWHSIAYGNGVWVAVAYTANSSTNLAYSTNNATSWTARVVTSTAINFVSFHHGFFYLVAGATVWVSADAVTWRSFPFPGAAANNRQAVEANGQLLYVPTVSGVSVNTAWVHGGVVAVASPPAGSYRLRVRARDAAGNYSSLSEPKIWPTTGTGTVRTTGQLWPR